MAEVPSVRASDAEREEVVALLRNHSVDGRLTLEEFAQRVDAAYAATTRAELEQVTADLPAARRAGPRRRPRRLTAVIFGAVERTGRWRMPRRALAFVLFGDAPASRRDPRAQKCDVTPAGSSSASFASRACSLASYQE